MDSLGLLTYRHWEVQEMDRQRLGKLIVGDRDDPRTELGSLFGEPATGPGAPPSALAWGQDRLTDAGVDPRVDQLKAIKILRDAEPRLGLKSAKYLTDVLAKG